ncbi:restriction endonuclease subunit S [Neomicrococcus lactis]|uniref:Type I restriction enzyme S subunit n=1 Tax=Neomicrococcus lactis TaxID=732241 RepID=A0A7W8YD70_9MICC|nr:restriction endonuclease subunit S [Neomicrococcus lactis]MBB5599334.1 type I restriction enzyme S subunit [Neomicrococcus lactis]
MTIIASPNTEWLGPLPTSWSVTTVRALVEDINIRNFGGKNENYLSLMANIGVILYADKGDVGNKKPEDLSKCKIVKIGDLVINSMNYGIGSYGISRYEGICSPVYLVLRTKSDVGDQNFVRRIFEIPQFQRLAQSFGNGILEHRRAIGWDSIKNLPVPMPPLDTQQKIAAFLDRETAQIDELIGKQERLIELLAEKRQAIITHAVTKGLDPNAPTKPSGIPWLGDIPSIWETKRLKHIVAMRSGESITAEDIESIGDYPVYGGNGLRGYTSAYTHEGEYALIGRQGALCGNVNLARGQFWASEHAIVPTPRIQISVHWLFHVLKWMNLGQYSMTAAQPGISADAIGGLPVPFPSFDEQQKIADYVERQTRTLDRLTVAASSAIQLLRERRSALISAAVTGKIDVREGVA